MDSCLGLVVAAHHKVQVKARVAENDKNDPFEQKNWKKESENHVQQVYGVHLFFAE